MFIDETWTKTNMTRLYGWAKRGKRLIDKTTPHGHWKTTTFVAALRNDRIDAPCRFDGPINGERFRAYVEQELVPTLKSDDIVFLDNLGTHKSKAVRSAVTQIAVIRRRMHMNACVCHSIGANSAGRSHSPKRSQQQGAFLSYCGRRGRRDRRYSLPTKVSVEPDRVPLSDRTVAVRQEMKRATGEANTFFRAHVQEVVIRRGKVTP